MLDPSHPEERLREICHRSQASLIVCSESLHTNSLQLITNIVTMGPEKAEVWSKATDIPALKSAVQPYHAVYAVSTSGSTGTPKGAVQQFPEAVRQFQANWMQITPSVARLLKPTEIPTIQTLVLGGEPLRFEDIDRWAHCVHILNAYGPSECSVISSIHERVEPGCDPDNIGFANDAVFWAVDKSNINQLIPIGAIGELIIEGPIQFRAQDQDQAPIYRTGDLVRYQGDGSLKYIGCKGSQNIELDKVEYHVKRSQAEFQRVVADIVKPPDALEPVLVASVCHRPSESLTPSGDLFVDCTPGFRTNAQAARSKLLTALPRRPFQQELSTDAIPSNVPSAIM
ncbi:hypothetical protein BDV27DRAFT_162885 [Aspergillus caelatus]|uniref:AMP-dependent synthetase/ligase domain-containing protein n=1 Tax=Aspergillus caelatus TaxID=61420 RepID=A0A5N6ZNG4_9EURO|nr:uncharacterized protein BDV27DRAFT_162885 [Aspergillus caelatus]KAE8359162.1 hypothetical protein BDV27DRAFT_162885 [Aspergillus caelatus]